MTNLEFLSQVMQAVDESSRALLATVSTTGYPAMRWMNPVFLPGKMHWMYCTTSKHFPKVHDLEKHNRVSWMITNNRSGEIYSLRGVMKVLDNPRFSSEIMEELGRRLENFWKLNPEASDVVVLETTLETGEYFNPKTGEKSQYVCTREGGAI